MFDGDDDDGSIGFFHPLLLLRERERHEMKVGSIVRNDECR